VSSVIASGNLQIAARIAEHLRPRRTSGSAGFPSSGRGALYLNVEAILLARPWTTFGRRQVDYAAGCSRKHYLAIVKGVREHSRALRPITWQSLAGSVAHDLIEGAASNLEAAQRRDDAFIRRALMPATIARLLALGVADSSAMISAISREELVRLKFYNDQQRSFRYSNKVVHGKLRATHLIAV
jgi:hypothetical protein